MTYLQSFSDQMVWFIIVLKMVGIDFEKILSACGYVNSIRTDNEWNKNKSEEVSWFLTYA
jgi:hypothetical protein